MNDDRINRVSEIRNKDHGMREYLQKKFKEAVGKTHEMCMPIGTFKSIEELNLFAKEAMEKNLGVCMLYKKYHGVIVCVYDMDTMFK